VCRRLEGEMLAFVLFACAGGIGQVIYDTDQEIEDLEAPIVRSSPITEPQVYGQDVLIEAVVKDPSDVFTVTLSYQAETAGPQDWHDIQMNQVGGDKTNGYFYQGFIKGNQVYSGGMRYYIQAVDDSNNSNVGCAPDRCKDDPFTFSVVPP
jgi:hypothetical protein